MAAKKQKADMPSRSSVTVFTAYFILPLGDFLNGTEPTEHRYLAVQMYPQSCMSSVYQGAERNSTTICVFVEVAVKFTPQNSHVMRKQLC